MKGTPRVLQVFRQRDERDGFTLVELLVVIAIISIIAGFLVPTLLRGRGEAYKAQCKNNLRQIAQSAMIYADSGKRFFPYGKGGSPTAHDSLNRMVEFFGSAKDLNPKLFICPTWRGDPAEEDDEGKYALDEDTCAYTWTDKKLGPTDSGYALSSDKYVKSEDQLSGHDKGMNIVYTDASVEFKDSREMDDDLPKGLVR